MDRRHEPDAQGGKGPIRILHVVGGMDRGGAETWLMHVLRAVDRERYHMDFLVHTTRHCDFDDEIRRLGSHLLPCLSPSRPWEYERSFLRLLRDHGPYDVVHSHVHSYSGYVLRLAERAGVPVRLAHSHSDTSSGDRRAAWGRRLYLRVTAGMIRRHATAGLACSRPAAAALFGAGWSDDRRWRVLYCGIDLDPFREPVPEDVVRREMGLPTSAFVVGHVGKMVEVKNHDLLLQVFAEILGREPEAWLLLVGDGPLRSGLEERAVRLGVRDRVVFAGLREDVPRLMQAAMDVFVLPSLHEGLPVAAVEAQAAGLPTVISDSVARETSVLQELVTFVPLSLATARWADLVVAAGRRPRALGQGEAVDRLSSTPFNVKHSCRTLQTMYDAARALP